MPWYIFRGQCCSSSRCESPLQIVMAFVVLYIWKKCAKQPLLSAEGCHTLLDHPEELFAEGRRALKAVKALWGLISRPILDLGFFLKPMSLQDTGRQLYGNPGNPGIVSLRQFWVTNVWTLLGQESPLMNKKGLISSCSWIHSFRHTQKHTLAFTTGVKLNFGSRWQLPVSKHVLCCGFKSTQAWEFLGLRFWILHFFTVRCA